jgi:putative Ca2+/H+ antiporter (TMEM165/GDT1 family)
VVRRTGVVGDDGRWPPTVGRRRSRTGFRRRVEGDRDVTDVGWLAVVGIAFGAQLAVLPGEKVQFIIAGLSTRYHPLLVVSAAGAAFAGWTAVEVTVGRAVQRALSGTVLDALTAGMFALFAVLLYRSIPDATDERTDEGALTDGGVLDVGDGLDVRVPLLDRRVPDALGGFLPIFAMMVFGEFGDKTQLVTITLAGNYPEHLAAIWVGEMLAIIPVSLANAYFFSRFSHRFNARKAHLAGAAVFAFFAVDTVLGLLTGFSVWETAVETLASVLA